MQRPTTWLIAALAGGALLAGCGGGGSSSSTTSSQTTSTPAATTSAPAATGSTPTSSTAAPSAAVVQQAIATCKRAIQAQSSLSSSSKSKLEAICDKAAKGDAAAVRKAAQEVCAEIIHGSAVASGPAREAALAACKKAK